MEQKKDHLTDCYFCITRIAGFSARNKKAIVYSNLTSVIRPFGHGDALLLPITFEVCSWCVCLVRDLNLSKAKVELLSSRLKNRNLLTENFMNLVDEMLTAYHKMGCM